MVSTSELDSPIFSVSSKESGAKLIIGSMGSPSTLRVTSTVSVPTSGSEENITSASKTEPGGISVASRLTATSALEPASTTPEFGLTDTHDTGEPGTANPVISAPPGKAPISDVAPVSRSTVSSSPPKATS